MAADEGPSNELLVLGDAIYGVGLNTESKRQIERERERKRGKAKCKGTIVEVTTQEILNESTVKTKKNEQILLSFIQFLSFYLPFLLPTRITFQDFANSLSQYITHRKDETFLHYFYAETTCGHAKTTTHKTLISKVRH